MPPMRISQDSADAIKLVSLWCSVLVCLNHAFTLDASYAAVAGEPFAFSTYFIQDAVKHGVVRMSTPFFFIVAAFLLFSTLVKRDAGVLAAVPLREGYRGEIAKRVRTLAIPFLLWAGWSFALVVALQQVPQLRGSFSEPLLAQPASVIAEKLLWNPVAHQLWFVRDLFLLALAWPLAWVLLRQRWIGLGVIAALCVPWFLWWEVRETRALVFFAIGAWLGIHRPAIPQPAGWALAATATLWLVGASLHATHIMRTGLTDPVYNNITILAELATVWFLTLRLLPWLRRPWLLRISGYTFFIYVAHEPVCTFARKAAVMALGNEPLMLFAAWLLAGFATFAGCLIAAMALHRWLPAVYGLLAGGRGAKRAPAPPVAAGGTLPAARVPA